jgi:diguanylate cyclase (GGDEF)-like protein
MLSVAAAWAVLAVTRGNVALGPRGTVLLSILPGVLFPLMFPRVSANVRAAVNARSRRAVESVCSDSYAEAWSPQSVIGELRCTNERLTKELRELRAAYAQLALEAANRREAVDKLNFLAYHDALTLLPNRALLFDRLTQALAYAQRAGTGVLVVYLDLNHFKAVNDSMGHAAGDRVLGEIAHRLAACIRDCDTASRVGGDEFVLVYTTADERDAALIEYRLLTAIGAPIDVGGATVTIGASLGMSLYPRDGSDPAALIDGADAAMYSAKLAGRA